MNITGVTHSGVFYNTRSRSATIEAASPERTSCERMEARGWVDMDDDIVLDGVALLKRALSSPTALIGEELISCKPLAETLQPYMEGVTAEERAIRAEDILHAFLQASEIHTESNPGPPRSNRAELRPDEMATIVGRLLLLELESTDGSSPFLRERREAVMAFGDGHPQGLTIGRVMAKPARYWNAYHKLLKAHLISSFGPSRSPDTAVSREAAMAIQDHWDQASSYYPSHLRPSALASLMTLSQAEVDEELVHRDDQELYYEKRTHGGQPATATLTNLRRAVVLGDPGFGKSTILAALCVANSDPAGPRPTILIRLSDVAGPATGSPPRTDTEALTILVDTFLSTAGSASSQFVPKDLISALGSDPKALIALDGLDEVLESEQRQAIADLIRHLTRIPGHIVVSSRFTGYVRPWGEWTELSVDSLEPDQAKEFMWKWYPAGSSLGRSRALEAIDNSDDVRALVAIPLMAGLVAFVAKNGAVPTKRSSLYQRYLSLFLERKWKPPASRRTDPIKILVLTKVARKIAWAMASGLRHESSSMNKWVDVTNLGEIFASLEQDQAIAKELVEFDGILTPHGLQSNADAILLQQFRWLHRTLHEHLVGMHLVEWFFQDRPAAMRFVAEAVQNSVWMVSLIHMMDALEVEEQDEVLFMLLELMEEGDPAATIQTFIRHIATFCSPNSEARARLARTYIVDQEWSYALELDPDSTKVAIRARIAATDFDRDKLEAILYAATYLPMDESLIRLLMGTFQEAERSYLAYAHCLALLAKFSPDEALQRALEVLRERPRAAVHVFEPLETVGAEVLNAIAREARDRPFPENLGFARLLDEIGFGATIFDGHDFEQREDLVVAKMVIELLKDWPPRRLVGPTKLIDAVLAGRKGDFAAFSIAVLSPPDDIQGHALCAWAEIGHLEVLLENEVVPEDQVSIADSQEAVGRLSGFTSEQLQDSEKMLAVLRALGACMQDCAPDQLTAVVDFWLKVGRHTDIGGNNHEDQIQFGVSADIVMLGVIAHHIARKQPWDVLWPIQQKALLQPDEYVRGYDPIVRDALGGDAGSVDDDLLFQLALWGQQNGVPTIDSFPQPKNADRLFRAIFEACDPSFLARKENISSIAIWLRRAGVLAAWRDRLLSLTQD